MSIDATITVSIAIAVAMFASASYFDLRTRKVSDLLWIGFGVAGAAVHVIYPPAAGEYLPIAVSIGFATAVSLGIYKFGFFGGADALALVAFSVIMPLYHGDYSLIAGRPVIHPMAPLILLTNALLLSVFQIVLNMARNLAYSSRNKGRLFEGLEHESITKKVFATIVGHRSANPQYSFPIERIASDGRREFDFAIRPAETADYETRRDVWVTSGMPFLVFMLAGLLIMVFGGDLLALIFGAIQ